MTRSRVSTAVMIAIVAIVAYGCATGTSAVAASTHGSASVYRSATAYVQLAPDQAFNRAENDIQLATARLYEEYQRHLKAYNAVDFDDLILRTVELFGIVYIFNPVDETILGGAQHDDLAADLGSSLPR